MIATNGFASNKKPRLNLHVQAYHGQPIQKAITCKRVNKHKEKDWYLSGLYNRMNQAIMNEMSLHTILPQISRANQNTLKNNLQEPST